MRGRIAVRKRRSNKIINFELHTSEKKGRITDLNK